MRGHLSFRSGNPALTSKTFKNFAPTSDNVMTLDGTVNKIAISLMILLFCSYYTFSTQNVSFIMIGIFGGLITAIVTIFKKSWAPYTVSSICCIRRIGSWRYIYNLWTYVYRNCSTGNIFNNGYFRCTFICL